MTTAKPFEGFASFPEGLTRLSCSEGCLGSCLSSVDSALRQFEARKSSGLALRQRKASRRTYQHAGPWGTITRHVAYYHAEDKPRTRATVTVQETARKTIARIGWIRL